MTNKIEQSVLIYAGEGTSEFCVQALYKQLQNTQGLKAAVKLVDHLYLREKPWQEECLLLAIPGGRGAVYYQYLDKSTNQKIKHYVENGGLYLGICAGAYYASRYTEFALGHSLEVTCQGELGFYPGYAVGPVQGLDVFSYEGHQGASTAVLNSNLTGDNLAVYYQGGCYFSDTQDHICDVLAWYQECGQAAAIQTAVGQGRALLIGTHVEVDGIHMHDHASQMPAQLVDKITETDKARNRFWQKSLSQLLHT